MDIAISKNGVPIRLTSERWQHITMGHPEIADYYYDILETIENPDIIYEGNNDAKIAVRKFQENFTKFVIAVYKETSKEDGLIITAHFSNKEQKFKKKKILWKQQS
ncbi:MAG: PBECR2 nuclease fold domain-containing protein [Bacteroidales bacterium]|nr:PBECR2 nuclease fold domain-containing protein [Bacteroidales bacterium]MDZ4204723.1 PBECR2 nuclease fold domain-containing protein [Bacteroidales bacterium]